MSAAAEFAARIRARERAVGYWVVMDAPAGTERVARQGYDYVCLDAQHGLFDDGGMRTGVLAVDAAATARVQGARVSVALVRVGANDPHLIGRALDAGAAGVIVPLVNGPEDAAAAVAAVRYPPHGVRSYGPMRSGLRIGPVPAAADDSVVVLAMIETPQGLDSVEEICAVPGLDGVYVGPSDLTLAVGGAHPGDPAVAEEFEAALKRVREVAADAGVAAGIHTPDGASAARRLGEGYTFASVASDVTHLEAVAAGHLAAAREVRP